MARINRNNTRAVMIDMQDRLLAAMPEKEKLMQNTEKLLKGLKVLGVPVTVTQQYTKGLGSTEESLMKASGAETYFDKIAYSCWSDTAIREEWQKDRERTVFLLFGVESHICLWQTARDLVEAGYSVQIVCDCISSRKPFDQEIALRRLESIGVTLTTAEACLFEMLERAGTDEFKAISKLVK